MGLAPLESPWAIIAALASVLIATCACLRRKKIKPATFAWAAPFAAVTVFFSVWCALGLCQIGAADFCACQVACGALGVLVLYRDSATSAFNKVTANMSHAISRDGVHIVRNRLAVTLLTFVRDAVLAAIAIWFSYVALESSDNANWAAIDPTHRNQALIIIALAIAFLYFLGQRRGALCVVVPVACVVLGLVQNFLDLFKNTALLPSDVLAWQTAAAVSGGYTYVLPTLAIRGIVCGCVALAALAYIVPTLPAASPSSNSVSARRVAGVAANLAICVLCAFGVWTNVSDVDYKNDMNVTLDYWDLRNSYHEHGFLLSFIAAMQDMRIDQPAGYSDEAAEQLQDELARTYDAYESEARKTAVRRFEDEKPSVIAIMNESYSDLSIFDELHVGYTGTFVTNDPERYDVEGALAMSVHGGGTCNSEYEFLACSSMGFLGGGTYPYQQFNFANVLTVPSAFKELGYTTWAMHPNYPGNWNREFVYASMGIDTSMFIDDFADAELFHGYVSDRATYDRALDILRSADGPQFVLDITMQNHGGYDTGSIPKQQMTDVRPDFVDDEAAFVLNEYLTCVQESDKALKHLFDELTSIDEPVAVVFFGDHQPSMSRDYNDALFPDEPELSHKARITQTPYFIWTNYGNGQKAGDASSSHVGILSSAMYLGAQLLESIGAPLDSYQKALLELHRQIPAVNTNGYCDAEGAWHDSSEGSAPEHPYCRLQTIHYLNVVRRL